jgi:predicted dienelactone hydrolase
VMLQIAYAETLTASGGVLAGLIDTSHIGVWGHEQGGTTALQAAGAQIDFKALDAWCADKASDRFARDSCSFVGHEQQVASRYGAADPFAGLLPPIRDTRVAALALAAPGGELHAFGAKGITAVTVPTLIMVSAADQVVKPEYNALWAYDGIGSEGKTLALFDQGTNKMFLDCCGYDKTRDGPRLDEVKALTTAFFLDILKHDPAGHAALLPNAVSFPGLTYKTTTH